MIVLSMRSAYSKNRRRRKFLIGTTTTKRKTQTFQKISQEDPLNDDHKIAIERTNEMVGLLLVRLQLEFSSLTRGRVSYARQIAVMTVHHGKKFRVRGKQNVNRTYPSLCPRLVVLADRRTRFLRRSEAPLIRRVFSAHRLPAGIHICAVPEFLRFPGTQAPDSRTMSRRNDYVAVGSSIDESLTS